MPRKYHRLILLALLGIFSLPCRAVLDIRITQGVEQALPIAVVPFGWTEAAHVAPLDMTAIITGDLVRSGRFSVMDEKDLPQRPTDFQTINFNDWRLLGMENLLIGQLVLTDKGDYEVEFRLVDVYKGIQIAGFRIPTTKERLRRTAHRISDIVFEKLVGVKGAFDTRIAYITVKDAGGKKKVYTLQIADADGYNPQVLLESPEPLMSPNWSPDGNKLAYVSFEGKNSAVYVQEILTGKREKVASNQGINSAPAWSPDGSRLALTLSKDGNTEVYILHLSSKLLQRITDNPAIDTEPAWSSDGSRLAFTSDRGGGPQIYEVDVRGGEPKRITFEGPYNARPVYSPDNKSMTMVHGNNGVYRIALLDLGSGYLNILTESRLDESPSFAPNGSMIIYATTGVRGSVLAAVSSDGSIQQRLAVQDGEVREPAWGPFQKQ